MLLPFAFPSKTPATDFYPYTIDNSLRFDGSNGYMYYVPSTSSSRTQWTFSAWVKRAKLGVAQFVVMAWDYVVNNQTRLIFNTEDTIELLRYSSGTFWEYRKTNRVFRDTSSWYHIVWVLDAANETQALRSRFYVNGEEIPYSDFTVTNAPSATGSSYLCTSGVQTTLGALVDNQPGSGQTTPSDLFSGYIADAQLIDEQVLDPTYFGEFKSGIWVPKEYTGSYGTNGFHLDFADGADLGNDAAGSNDFIPSGIATSDQMLDSPTNNFATLNPLGSLGNHSEGNLRISSPTGAWCTTPATILLPKTGLWYVEGRSISGGNAHVMMGVAEETQVKPYASGTFPGSTSTSWAVIFDINGQKIVPYTGGVSQPDIGSGFTSSMVAGIVWDAGNGALYAYKDGTLVGTAFTGRDTSKDYVLQCGAFSSSSTIAYNFGNDGTFGGLETGGNSDANGYGDFAYTPPTVNGTPALALCTQNLPDPTFDPRVGESPQDAFNVYTDTGANILSTAQSDYSDGLFWIKDYQNPSTDHQLLNTVTNTVLESNTTDAERDYSAPSGSSVAWSWKAATAFSGTTNLGKSYSGKSNAAAGISIVTYTGAGSGHQIPHNLADVPKFIVIKQRTPSGTEHVTYHASQAAAPELGYLLLGTSGAYVPSSTIWADTAPTSSYVTLGASSSVSANTTYTMLAFAEKEGFSKFGSYEGNGDTTGDGPLVYLGFRPAFVLIKNVDQSGGHWIMYDNARDTDGNLNSKKVAANLSKEENEVNNLGDDTFGIDFLSNGFKIKTYGINHNNTVAYVYAAFAEQPFRYSNAR